MDFTGHSWGVHCYPCSSARPLTSYTAVNNARRRGSLIMPSASEKFIGRRDILQILLSAALNNINSLAPFWGLPHLPAWGSQVKYLLIVRMISHMHTKFKSNSSQDIIWHHWSARTHAHTHGDAPLSYMINFQCWWSQNIQKIKLKKNWSILRSRERANTKETVPDSHTGQALFHRQPFQCCNLCNITPNLIGTAPQKDKDDLSGLELWLYIDTYYSKYVKDHSTLSCYYNSSSVMPRHINYKYRNIP